MSSGSSGADDGRTVRVRLAHKLTEELAAELARRIYFVSATIENFELVRSDGLVESVTLTLTAPCPEHVMAAKINRVVTEEILNHRPLPAKVAWRSPVQRPHFTDYFPQLAERGGVFVSGDGQVGFGEPLISLMNYLDERLRDIVMSLENSREYQYPTLLPVSVLERFGYLGSFPQFAMFVTRLHNDIDVYRTFAAEYLAANGQPDGLLRNCPEPDYCLPPTMCYHTYHQHQGQRLGADTVVTARGKAFRYESRYHASLERLWDFTIREMVFLGSPPFPGQCRDSVMRQAFALMEELELAGRCEVANDPFFASADTAAKIFSQRLMELKWELLLEVAPGRSIAAGSFNLHGGFFGESFEISAPDGTPVTSGCAGFGLERLVHAFACQHGPDVPRWPAAVRRAVGPLRTTIA